MSKRKDVESEQAAAKLQRLAEATALLRLYRESEGHDARSLDAVTAWAQRHPEIGNPVTPSEEDQFGFKRPSSPPTGTGYSVAPAPPLYVLRSPESASVITGSRSKNSPKSAMPSIVSAVLWNGILS